MAKKLKPKTKITQEEILKMYRKVNREEAINSGNYMANPPKVEKSKKAYTRKKKNKKYDVD